VRPLLLLALCGCLDTSLPEPDETVRGVMLTYASRTYEEMPAYLDACAAAGVRVAGARVRFWDSEQAMRMACGHTQPIAGCAWRFGRLAYVLDAETLRETALCHELLHTDIDDPAHEQVEAWARLREAGL